MSGLKNGLRLVCVGLTALLLCTSCDSSRILPSLTDIALPDSPVLTTETFSEERHVPESMDLISEKGFLALYANMETGETAVEDRRTGNLWYSNPVDREEDAEASGAMKNWLSSQLVVTTIEEASNTYKTNNSYVSCTKRGGVIAEKTKDGLKVTYNFVKEKYTIPVYYTLLGDSLRAEVAADEIREDGDVSILTIALLPTMGAQNKRAEGFILVSNGSGGVIGFNNGKTEGVSAYRMPIYGDDTVTVQAQQLNKTEETLLPVLGLSASDRGLLAICDRGAGQGYLNASPAGLQTGYNTAGFEFELRITQLVTVGSDDGGGRDVTMLEKTKTRGRFGVRYFFLDASQVGLAGMADVTAAYYRTLGITIREQPKEAPVYLSVLGAIRYPSSVVGFPVDVTRVMTDYTQASEMLDYLVDQQVSGVRMLYDGWSRSQLEGKITTKYDSLGSLGSTKDLIVLQSALTAQGGGLALRASTVKYFKSGNGYSLRSDSIRDGLCRTVELPFYKRNTFFADNDRDTGRMLSIRQSAQAFDRLVSAVPQVGVLIGEYGNTLYTDYGGDVYKRYQAETLAEKTLQAAAEKVSLYGDAPYAYTWASLAEAVNLPMTTTMYSVVDRAVPFVQMVLRQLMPCGSSAVNISGNMNRDFLRTIASGIAPHYEVSASFLEELKNTDAVSYYGADFDTLKKTIVEQYADWSDLYSLIIGAKMLSYAEPQTGVLKTTYDNGVYTVVNLNTSPITLDGERVPAEDFIIRGGTS